MESGFPLLGCFFVLWCPYPHMDSNWFRKHSVMLGTLFLKSRVVGCSDMLMVRFAKSSMVLDGNGVG